jgi:hypothetical protein
MMYSFIIHIYYHSSCLLILIQLWLQYCPFRAQQQGSQLSQPMMQQVAMETGGDAASSQAPPTTPLPSAASLSTPAPGTPSAEPKTLVFPRESSNGVGDKEDPNKVL